MGIRASRQPLAPPARPAGPSVLLPAGRPPPSTSVHLADLAAAVRGSVAPVDREQPKRYCPMATGLPAPHPGQASAGPSGLDTLSQAIMGKQFRISDGQGEEKDVRVLAVLYDQQGQRFRSFADAIVILEEIVWPDSPVKGPCTVLWVCRFIRENAGTPTQWHIRWTSLAKLQASDEGVALHEVSCRALEIAVCYNQLSIGALATIEYLARQIQTQEQRWRDRITGTIGDQQQEAQLFSGVSGRTPLCISPALQEWVAEEARKESAVLKEQRKAREERALARPK